MLSINFRLALIATVLALLPAELTAAPYGSGWYGEVQAAVGHEDNISRSFMDSDVVSDEISSLSIGGGYLKKIRGNSELVLYSYLAANVHQEYDDLDHLAVTLGASYTFAPNTGFSSFWYNADIRTTLLRYNESEAREGVRLNSDLNLNQRLGTRATWHLGYRYNDMIFAGKSKSEKERDAAFDVATHEVYIGADYELKTGVFIYAEYARQRGDVWSNVSSNEGDLKYDARTLDPVFDDCANHAATCQPRYAGRIRSDVDRLNIGTVFPIGSVHIDVSAIYYEADADNGESYRDWFVSAGLIWHF